MDEPDLTYSHPGDDNEDNADSENGLHSVPISRPVSRASAFQEEVAWPAMEPEELEVFRPLQEMQIDPLDLRFPISRRTSSRFSWHLGEGGFGARTPTRMMSNRKAKRQSQRLESNSANRPSRPSVSHEEASGDVGADDANYDTVVLDEAPPPPRQLEDGSVNPQEADPEYPHGFKLLIMLAALVSSIFLIALDMVGVNFSPPVPSIRPLTNTDHRRDSDSGDHGRISRYLGRSLVRSHFLHDGRWLPSHLGQGLQVFPPEDQLFNFDLYLRSGQSHLRSRPFISRFHHRPRYCRRRRRRRWRRLLHHRDLHC